jgi:hypothetical protein
MKVLTFIRSMISGSSVSTCTALASSVLHGRPRP